MSMLSVQLCQLSAWGQFSGLCAERGLGRAHLSGAGLSAVRAVVMCTVGSWQEARNSQCSKVCSRCPQLSYWSVQTEAWKTQKRSQQNCFRTSRRLVVLHAPTNLTGMTSRCPVQQGESLGSNMGCFGAALTQLEKQVWERSNRLQKTIPLRQEKEDRSGELRSK